MFYPLNSHINKCFTRSCGKVPGSLRCAPCPKEPEERSTRFFAIHNTITNLQSARVPTESPNSSHNKNTSGISPSQLWMLRVSVQACRCIRTARKEESCEHLAALPRLKHCTVKHLKIVVLMFVENAKSRRPKHTKTRHLNLYT